MKKVVLWCVGVLLVLMVAAYGVGVVVFHDKYLLNTSVNGIPAAYKTRQEISLELLRRTKNEQFLFVLPNGTVENVTFSFLGISRPAEADIDSFPVQSSFTWPISLFEETECHVDESLAINESALNAGIQKLRFVVNGVTASKDAYVEQNDEGRFVIVPDILGDEVDTNIVMKAVQQAINDGVSSVRVDTLDCYKYAAVRADDEKLTMYCNAANNFRNMQISLDFAADTVEVLSADLLDSFRVMNGVEADVNESAVAEYVTALAAKYNTYGTERQFHTSTDEDVVVKNRAYTVCDFDGWQMDEEAFYEQLLAALRAGEDTLIEVPWTECGVTHGKLNDFGDTYLEISIDNQHMWLIVDGECICDTDIVTGMAGTSKATPRGIFRTTDFYTEMTMRGSYGTAFCHYFIRVTLGGVGVHDASWRSVYGGKIYLTNGSHGCINTPYDSVKVIFKTLRGRDVYTPIIIW